MTPTVVLTCFVLAQQAASPPAGRAATAPSTGEIVASLESVMIESIARAEPSVVAIHRVKGRGPQTQAVRGRRTPLAGGDGIALDLPNEAAAGEDFISFDHGSGVVIGDQGEILTAFHVVRGAVRLDVRGVGAQAFEAEVLAADPRSDLAVIAPVQRLGVNRPRLKPLPIGDASRLRKGSFLVALGNSFNAARDDGSPSASWGILSNVARRLDGESDGISVRPVLSRLEHFPTLLQLDAKLNLGMSGGAVINLKGELVAITTTAASPAGFDAQAGYAIPMDRIGRRAVEALRQGKEVEYGLLGIQPEQAQSNRVSVVRRNSPAARGHIQVGDEIIAVNDTPIADFEALLLAINAFAPGDPVRLKIRRSDQNIERTLVLGKYPMRGEVIATNRPRPWRGLSVDYSSAMNDPTFGPDLLEMTAAGVVVTDVEENSPAAAAGIRKGTLILRVADHPIQDPRTFAEAVAGQDGPVVLDTEIGLVTVGTLDSPRPKPSAPSRSFR